MTMEKQKRGPEPRAEDVLLRLVKKRDENALRLLYEIRGRMVYSLALSILADESEAEEITGEVFFRVWEGADKYDHARGTVLAWLTRLTRQLAIARAQATQSEPRVHEAAVQGASSLAAGARDVPGGWMFSQSWRAFCAPLRSRSQLTPRLPALEGPFDV